MSTTTTTQLEPAARVAEDHELSELGQTSRGQVLGQTPPAGGDVGPEEKKKLDRKTILKLTSAGFCFFVAGVNDGSIGALVPYVIREYGVNTAIVSSIYAASFLGWLLTALTNTHLAQFLDLGSMLALGASFQILSHALRAWKPPFPLYTLSFCLASLGQAFQDTHANTFVAGVGAAHRWLAFIHAMYMAGCLTGPFVATAVAARGETARWYLFYLFPLALGVVNLAWVLVAFRDSLSIRRKSSSSPSSSASSSSAGGPEGSRNKGALKLIRQTLGSREIWLISLFFFFFLGAVLTASGWVVEYLVVVRSGDLSKMGYVPVGFNGGAFLGRLLLAEPTYRLGERRMVCIYSILCVGLQLVFWLVPNIIAASVAISFLGFFSGPFFATGISVASKLFHPESRSTALAFLFVFAQIGGCLFPIVTGVIAAGSGVAVLQPILVSLLGATVISWLMVPKPKESGNAALHQE
ncbi:related to tetracycline resistance proteins [Cephalotrichum gorgonifer]|uniref:Related to tetracycline resistance proteins n=1 Tax=Cephalotrichum gorgonifer TaxID=2041049 RepID=A0AAE8SVR0_9PEZI|nr:related to tetracycline resistance proteins [Cephalotrichum gorgonifer]